MCEIDWGTWALVFVGVIQAVIFVFQWSIFRKQKDVFEEQAKQLRSTVEQMQIAEQRELRAYVFADEHPETHTNPAWQVNQTSALRIPIKVSNYGKTPAYDSMTFIEAKIDGYEGENLDLKKLIERQAKIVSLAIVAPNVGNYQSEANIGPLVKTPEWDIKKWIGREIAIFIYGTVIYRDVFYKVWQSDFRFMISFDGKPEPETGLTICQEGNEEKECTPEILELLKRIRGH